MLGALLLSVANASDLSAVYMNGRLHGPQVFTGDGFHSVAFYNKSREKATFDVYRLLPGTNLAEFTVAERAFKAALTSGNSTTSQWAALSRLAQALGGAAVSAHGKSEVYVDLHEGTYAITAVPGGRTQDLLVAQVMVVGNNSAVRAPTTVNTVHLSDFSFDYPRTVTAGASLWRVINGGEQMHKTEFFRLLPGKTVADLQAYLLGEVAEEPYDKTASFEELSPHTTGFMSLNLAAGRWVAACLMHDANDPTATHFGEGMIGQIVVF